MGAGASTPISLVNVQSATKIFVWESLANKSIQQITFCTASGQTSGCGSIQSSTNRDCKIFTMTKSNERIVRVQFQQSLKLGLLNIQFTTSTGQMSSRFGAKRIDADYLSYVFAAPSHSGGIKSVIFLSGAMIIAGFELMDSSIFGIAVKSDPNGEFQPKKNNNKTRRKSVDTIDPKDLEDFVEDLTEVLEMLEEGRDIDDVVDENGENIGCDGFNVDDEERFDGEHSGLSEDGDCGVACGNEFDESYGYNGGEFNDEGEQVDGGYDGAGFGACGLDGEEYDAGVFDGGGYDNTGGFNDGGRDLKGYDTGGFDGGGYNAGAFDGGGYTGGFDAGGFGGGYEVEGFCGGGYDGAWGSC